MEHEHGTEVSKQAMEHEHGTEVSKRAMEHEHGIEDSKHLAATSNDGDPLTDEKVSSFSSTSFSSSGTSNSDPLELNNVDNDAHQSSFMKSEEDGPKSPIPGYVSSPDDSGQAPGWSMISVSPRAGTGFTSSAEEVPQNSKWSTVNASTSRFSQIQSMAQPPGYDPNRIPSSVFASKPTTPMEWSVASNESLFSIHMGNSSFSRDHAILLGKSEEVAKPDDNNIPPSSLPPVNEAKSNDTNNLKPVLPTVIEAGSDNDRKSADIGDDPVMKEVLIDTKMESAGDHHKETFTPADEGHFPANISNAADGRGVPLVEAPRCSASPSHLSDESGRSSSSFAFPLLAGEGSPWKGSPEKPRSKPQPQLQPMPQPPLQPQTPGTTRRTGNKWLCCFSCCPLWC